jgi:ABC-type transport system involved in multi-copper enzyme maturation permease subunit
MTAVIDIARLTLRETQRRRILWAGLLMGIGFLVIFAIGFYFIEREISRFPPGPSELRMIYGFLLTAGLYATNLLVILMAVLISVTTISGEIESHTIESLVTKPISRWQIVIGKWLAYALLVLVYLLMLAVGLMIIVYVMSGFRMENIAYGLALMGLQALVVLSLSIAGGTRLSTLANGVVAFMLFGIAFLGGWVEQIGALFRNEAAVNIGILTSLIMPADILWKKALSLFQPTFTSSPMAGGPFAVTSQPSDLMIVYAVLYTLGLLAFALWSFTRRDL